MIAIEYLLIAIALYIIGCVTGFKVAVGASSNRNLFRNQIELKSISATPKIENLTSHSAIPAKLQLGQDLKGVYSLNTQRNNSIHVTNFKAEKDLETPQAHEYSKECDKLAA